MKILETDTLLAQNIETPLLISSYTADDDREVYAQVYLSPIIGNGSYRVCTTKQLLGVGTVFQSPTSAVFVKLGVTTIYLSSFTFPVAKNDIVNVYIQGLTGDTNVNCICQIFDNTSASTCLGTGSVDWDYYVYEPGNIIPIAGVYVRVYTEDPPVNLIASGITNSFGKITFYLDPGTYHLHNSKVGYTFVNPDVEVVP